MKGGVITIHELMLSEQIRLDNQINSLKEKLQHLPPGKLLCSRNGKYYKWFQIDENNKSYIPKENRQLAETLAIKKYLSLQLQDLENEKCVTQFYLNHHTYPGKAEQLLTQTSEYKNLLAPFFKPLSQELSDWTTESFEHNTLYPEQLIHKSSSGNLVRSKSEAMIDMFLYIHKIPFRYECALSLDETTIYPDFTIRHPKTGEIYYWEHFGLMDNPTYARNTYAKLQLYTVHGIIPTIQLITTYETKDHPLSTAVIEKLVKHYFC